MDEEIKKELLSCIEEAMQEEGLSEMKIDFKGTNEKGEGFIADFTFATVSGIDTDNKCKKVDLAVKVGKRSKQSGENMPPLLEYYKRETFVYGKIFPTFRKFQLEKNIVNPFSAVPKCYKTFTSDVLEALVLEDLKKKGFALHDNKQALNLSHIKLVLKNYAKLHALSFAFRDQKDHDFNELTANLDSHLIKMVQTFQHAQSDGMIPTQMREAGRNDLAEKLEELMKKGKNAVILEILGDVPQESVIIHGDCHNNNFLFEYQDDNNENPLSVAIIDWQLSQLHSPVIDLSMFIFCTASKEGLDHLDLLLRFYHSHLTEFLTQLGSDPEKIFPYSKLIEHWKKYSPFPFLLATSFLHIWYVDKENIPSVGDMTGEGSMERIIKGIGVIQRKVYRHRLLSIVDHFFSFKLT